MSKMVTAAGRVAELLAEHRTFQGVADATGLTVSQVHRFSRGRCDPMPESLKKLGLKYPPKYDRAS